MTSTCMVRSKSCGLDRQMNLFLTRKTNFLLLDIPILTYILASGSADIGF